MKDPSKKLYLNAENENSDIGLNNGTTSSGKHIVCIAH